jgi:L-fucose mutarotase/ribose pyranase (RbsD/FucU family)
MTCSVCKNKFIITKTNLGYMIQKKIIEDQLIKYIDENIETNELDCWDKHLIKKQCFYRQPKNQINVLQKVAVQKYAIIVIEKVMYVCSVKIPPPITSTHNS